MVDVKCLARKKLCLLRWLRPGESWRPRGPPFQFLFLCLSPPQGVGLLPEFVFVCFVTFLGESDVRWLCLVGAVVNRPKPWTRLRCSESHWSNPVVLPAGQPGAPVSSKSLPAWFVRWWMRIGDSAACPLCWWVVLVLDDTADVYFVYCNALQVFQGRWHPEMSWTVLRLALLTNSATTSVTLTKVKMVWLTSWFEVRSFCGMISLSKCGVIVFYGSMLFACLLTILHGFFSIWALPTAEDYHWQSSIICSGVHISPMKLVALHSMFCDGCMDDFHCPANLPERHYRMPPCGGGTWYNDHCDILAYRGWTI